jgi:hypothetical protein
MSTPPRNTISIADYKTRDAPTRPEAKTVSRQPGDGEAPRLVIGDRTASADDVTMEELPEIDLTGDDSDEDDDDAMDDVVDEQIDEEYAIEDENPCGAER